MSSNAGQIRVVYGRLTQARRAWKFIDVGSHILRGLTFLLIALLAGLVADNLLVLPRVVRCLFALGFLAWAFRVLVIQVSRQLKEPRTDEMVATHVEQAYPELDNRLINAVLLHKEKIHDPVTRQMVESQLGETVSAVRRYDMTTAGYEPASVHPYVHFCFLGRE